MGLALAAFLKGCLVNLRDYSGLSLLAKGISWVDRQVFEGCEYGHGSHDVCKNTISNKELTARILIGRTHWKPAKQGPSPQPGGVCQQGLALIYTEVTLPLARTMAFICRMKIGGNCFEHVNTLWLITVASSWSDT